MSRCRHDIGKGWMGVLDSHSDGHSSRTRCRMDEGHNGQHHAWYQPFPGFADEHIYWGESP